MAIQDTLRIAFKAMRRNKVRSVLTMLGVIIGVASVIAMIALGSGARAAIDEQIQSQGTTLIYVSSGSFNRGGAYHDGVWYVTARNASLSYRSKVYALNTQSNGDILWTNSTLNYTKTYTEKRGTYFLTISIMPVTNLMYHARLKT